MLRWLDSLGRKVQRSSLQTDDNAIINPHRVDPDLVPEKLTTVLVFPPLDAPRAVFLVAQKRLPEEAPQRGRGTGGAALAPPVEQDDVPRLALLDHQFVYGLHGGYAAA